MICSDSTTCEATESLPGRTRLSRWREALFSPARRDYTFTFLTEYFVLMSQLLVYKLAASAWGTEGFSEYALSRRTLALIQPLALLGFGVALPRYIAMTHANRVHKPAQTYFAGALLCVGCATGMFFLCMNLFRDSLAFLIFGSINYSHLILPISLMLLGLTMHSLCYAYFRGLLNMRVANRLQIVNIGIIPPLAFLTFGNTVETLLAALGILWAIVSSIAMLFIPFRQLTRNLLPSTKEMLRYGIPRVPGDFILMALFALPGIFVAHISGVKEAGYVAFAISALSMVGSLFSPLGIVLLPKASRMVGEGSLQSLKKNIVKIVKVCIGLAALITVICEIFARSLIVAYLGAEFHEMAGILRIVMLCALPYALFICLRAVIDAAHIKPFNMVNTFIAFAVFITGSILAQSIMPGSISVLGSLVLGIAVLGTLTTRETWKIFFIQQVFR